MPLLLPGKRFTRAKLAHSIPYPTSSPSTPSNQDILDKISNLARELQDLILEQYLLADGPPELAVVLPYAEIGCGVSYLRPANEDDIATESAITQIQSSRYNASWAYKPPVSLQLNRAIRAKFAKSYYTSSTFYVKSIPGRKYDLHKWLRSLEPIHRDMIKAIKWEGVFGQGLQLERSFYIREGQIIMVELKDGMELGLKTPNTPHLFPESERLFLHTGNGYADFPEGWYSLEHLGTGRWR